MRLLVITYSYAPACDPRSFRWSAICNFWASRGIVVDVVCVCSNFKLPKTETQNGVNIFRVKDPSLRFRKFDSELKEATKKAVGLLSLRSYVLRLSRSLLKKIIVMFRWPDFAWLVIPSLYFQSKKLMQTNQYDGIFSVALPFSSHVASWLLGVTRNNIPWICDYGDPFSFMKESPLNNYRLYDYLNRIIEKKIIESSKKISVTTFETAQRYASYLKVNLDWFYHIPPLFSGAPVQFISKLNNQESLSEEIKFIFAGTLYKNIRNPRFLLSLLQALRLRCGINVSIYFYGTLEDCRDCFDIYQPAIGDWIHLNGVVEKNQLLELYGHMDVLVNIGNATTYQAPSKIIEYMSTGLPILNLATLQEDSSQILLRDYPVVLNIYESEFVDDSMLDKLVKFIQHRRRVSQHLVNEILEPYQCQSIAESYLELLK